MIGTELTNYYFYYVKREVVLCVSYRRFEKEVELHAFLTMALDKRKWSGSLPGLGKITQDPPYKKLLKLLQSFNAFVTATWLLRRRVLVINKRTCDKLYGILY